jgi:hypothetical protein
VIQEATEGRLALNLGLERRFCGVVEGQRNDITDSLVRAEGVVMVLDDGERAAQERVARARGIQQRRALGRRHFQRERKQLFFPILWRWQV